MKYLVKLLTLSFLLFSYSCVQPQTQPLIPDISGLTQSEEIIGLWSETFSWSENQGFYFPESYAYQGDIQDETFFLFNSDGTGSYFTREIKIDNFDINKLDGTTILTYDIGYNDSDGNWVSDDKLCKNYEIFWGVDCNGNIVIYREDYTGEFIESTKSFEITTNNNQGWNIDRYILGDDLIISEFTKSRKLSADYEMILIEKYNL